ncbi:MAG: hypothetical protein ACT4QF_09570 [Sporichthyaceae bacterium]
MNLNRALSATVVAACLAVVPSAALAAPAGDAPGDRKHHGPTRIQICKFGLDTFDVYAAGTDVRHASLGYGKKVCTTWGTVEPGMYDLAFAQRIASKAKVKVLARMKVGDRKPVQKVFNGEGVINALVKKGDTLKLYLYEKRQSGH